MNGQTSWGLATILYLGASADLISCFWSSNSTTGIIPNSDTRLYGGVYDDYIVGTKEVLGEPLGY